MPSTSNKPDLRQHFQLLRDSMPPAKREAWDKAILVHLLAHPLFEDATHLFTYLSFRSEVDTRGIIEAAWAAGKSVSIPRLKGEKAAMEAVPLRSWDMLVQGPFGLQEPHADIAPIVLPPGSLILVPGLAFDRDGHRLGFGGGYYDRYLAHADTGLIRIGLAYQVQVTDKLPADTFDQRVAWTITEKGWIASETT